MNLIPGVIASAADTGGGGGGPTLAFVIDLKNGVYTANGSGSSQGAMIETDDGNGFSFTGSDIQAGVGLTAPSSGQTGFVLKGAALTAALTGAMVVTTTLTSGAVTAYVFDTGFATYSAYAIGPTGVAIDGNGDANFTQAAGTAGAGANKMATLYSPTPAISGNGAAVTSEATSPGAGAVAVGFILQGGDGPEVLEKIEIYTGAVSSDLPALSV